MNNRKFWTKEEDKKLLKEYGKRNRKVLARELGRTPSAITSRYHYLKKDEIGKYKKNFKKAKNCPLCGSRRINEVTTFLDKRTMKVNYCLDCLHEFTKDGEIIPPLWRHELYEKVL